MAQKDKKLSKFQVKRKITSLKPEDIKNTAIEFDLNPEQMTFALEYMKSGNATRSYMKAYGSKEASISVRNMANQLKNNKKVISFITVMTNKLYNSDDDNIANPFDIIYTLSSIINDGLFTYDKYSLIMDTYDEYVNNQEDKELLIELGELLKDVDKLDISARDRINASKALSEMYDRYNLFDNKEDNDNISDTGIALDREEILKELEEELYGK